MNIKKILWLVTLIVLVVALVMVIIMARPRPKNEQGTLGRNFVSGNIISESSGKIESSTDNKEEYKKIELDDGILYTNTEGDIKVDVVLRDNFFDTTISEMYLNSKDYIGKIIEIEGMYLCNDYYSFVGRYSTSNLCPYCPVGLSYMEINLDGIIDRDFTPEEDWIKVIGSFEVGNDESSNYEDYYYINVLKLEVMNERGNDTVNN